MSLPFLVRQRAFNAERRLVHFTMGGPEQATSEVPDKNEKKEAVKKDKETSKEDVEQDGPDGTTKKKIADLEGNLKNQTEKADKADETSGKTDKGAAEKKEAPANKQPEGAQKKTELTPEQKQGVDGLQKIGVEKDVAVAIVEGLKALADFLKSLNPYDQSNTKTDNKTPDANNGDKGKEKSSDALDPRKVQNPKAEAEKIGTVDVSALTKEKDDLMNKGPDKNDKGQIEPQAARQYADKLDALAKKITEAEGKQKQKEDLNKEQDRRNQMVDDAWGKAAGQSNLTPEKRACQTISLSGDQMREEWKNESEAALHADIAKKCGIDARVEGKTIVITVPPAYFNGEELDSVSQNLMKTLAKVPLQSADKNKEQNENKTESLSAERMKKFADLGKDTDTAMESLKNASRAAKGDKGKIGEAKEAYKKAYDAVVAEQKELDTVVNHDEIPDGPNKKALSDRYAGPLTDHIKTMNGMHAEIYPPKQEGGKNSEQKEKSQESEKDDTSNESSEETQTIDKEALQKALRESQEDLNKKVEGVEQRLQMVVSRETSWIQSNQQNRKDSGWFQGFKKFVTGHDPYQQEIDLAKQKVSIANMTLNVVREAKTTNTPGTDTKEQVAKKAEAVRRGIATIKTLSRTDTDNSKWEVEEQAIQVSQEAAEALLDVAGTVATLGASAAAKGIGKQGLKYLVKEAAEGGAKKAAKEVVVEVGKDRATDLLKKGAVKVAEGAEKKMIKTIAKDIAEGDQPPKAPTA